DSIAAHKLNVSIGPGPAGMNATSAFASHKNGFDFWDGSSHVYEINCTNGVKMKIGYARTSTEEQVAGFEAQKLLLADAGCEKVFREQLSSVDAQRPQLEAALEFCREGDVFICTKLDRLARSVSDVVGIAKRLREKGAAVLILDPRLSNATPAEELVFN